MHCKLPTGRFLHRNHSLIPPSLAPLPALSEKPTGCSILPCVTLGFPVTSSQACPHTQLSPASMPAPACWPLGIPALRSKRMLEKLMCPITAASIFIRTNLLRSREAVPEDSFCRQAYCLHPVSEIKVASLLEKG